MKYYLYLRDSDGLKFLYAGFRGESIKEESFVSNWTLAYRLGRKYPENVITNLLRKNKNWLLEKGFTSYCLLPENVIDENPNDFNDYQYHFQWKLL